MRSRFLHIMSMTAILCLTSAALSIAQESEVTLDAGKHLFETGRFEEAEAVFKTLTKQDKKSAPAQYWLGMALHELQRDKDAINAFKKAVKLDKTMVDGHLALARVYLAVDKKKDARKAAEKAIDAAPGNADAYYYLGLGYDENVRLAALRRGKVKKVFENQLRPLQQAIELNPDHPDAHYRIGLAYERLLEDFESALPFFFRQASINSDHTDALTHLSRACIATQQYQYGSDLFGRLAERHGESAHPLVRGLNAQLEAYYYHDRRQETRAFKAYETFLDVMKTHEPETFTRYRDLSLVADNKVVEQYEQLAGANKEELWRQFWAVRDPDPTTPINERLAEHYRRIMFALQNFSKGQQPWDTRGDIYIRYGEPDDRQHFVFRSGSNVMENYMPTGNAKIDAVRETNRYQYQLQVSNGAAPWSAGTSGVGGFMNRASSETQATAFATESWVYVPYNLELFFTDQMNNGNFDYPLLPTELPAATNDYGSSQGPGFRFMAGPRQRVDALIKKQPESYQYDYGGEPLNFIYDLVTFRGDEGQAQIEVAYSIPTDQLGNASDGSGMETWFNSRIALQDQALRHITGSEAFTGPVARPLTKPDKNKVELRTAGFSFQAPEGVYRSSLAVKDSTTKRVGIFLKPFTVRNYSGDGLQISDIKLATTISTGAAPGPFTRHGIQITPHPAHIYAQSQPVYIYYEVYNLDQDVEQRTSFETGLKITAKEKQRNFAWRLLTSIGNLVTSSSNDQAVLISYEDAGMASEEHRYTSIDTSELPTGPYTLTLTITDRQSGQTATSETDFVIAK